jgi:hypothetical protein
VTVRFTEWGGGAHGEFPVLERPGAWFSSDFPWVTLFPHEQPLSVYLDVATP